MDTADRSVLRLVTDDLEPTKRVLTSLGTKFEVGEVLSVQMDNRPGTLARVLERLAEEHINIEYAYVSTATEPGRCLGMFHTSNPKRALQVLQEAATASSERRVDSGTGGRPTAPCAAERNRPRESLFCAGDARARLAWRRRRRSGSRSRRTARSGPGPTT